MAENPLSRDLRIKVENKGITLELVVPAEMIVRLEQQTQFPPDETLTRADVERLLTTLLKQQVAMFAGGFNFLPGLGHQLSLTVNMLSEISRHMRDDVISLRDEIRRQAGH